MPRMRGLPAQARPATGSIQPASRSSASRVLLCDHDVRDDGLATARREIEPEISVGDARTEGSRDRGPVSPPGFLQHIEIVELGYAVGGDVELPVADGRIT